MKLHVTSVFPADPTTIFDLFQDPEFERRLASETGFVYKKNATREEGPITVVDLECSSRSELPAIAAKALGSKHLSYRQINRLDRANTRLDWEVKLPGLGNKVTVNGRTTIVPEGTGCRRTVDGNVNISIPLIGGRIEKAIVSSFEKSYHTATTIVLSMLEG